MPQSEGSYEQSRQGKGGGRSSARQQSRRQQKTKVSPRGKTIKPPASQKIRAKKRGKRPRKELYRAKVEQVLTCCIGRVDQRLLGEMVANRHTTGPQELINYVALDGKSIGDQIIANFGQYYKQPERLERAAYDILSAKAEADAQKEIEKRRYAHQHRKRSQKPRPHRERYQPQQARRKTA